MGLRDAERVTVRQMVGATTYARGADYAQRGAVRAWWWEPDGKTLAGEVEGSRARPYRVAVELRRSQSARLTSLYSMCSCPVETYCKHAIALLLAQLAACAATDAGGTTGRAAPAPSAPQEPAPARSARIAPGRDLAAARGRSLAAAGEVVAAAGEVVAAARDVIPTTPPRHGASPGPAPWEEVLRDLVAAPAPTPAASSTGATCGPRVGLQVELVTFAPGPGRPAGARIRLRPVLPGRAGNWVRSGVSWSTLRYRLASSTGPGRIVREVALLEELSGLAAHRGPYRYNGGDEPVWLDAIGSRRVWDLLSELRSAGVPLLHATGRPPAPVGYLPEPAVAVVDLRRNVAGLLVGARVTAGELVVPLSSSVLLGRPAHGIVWWESPSGRPDTHARLFMAPLAGAPADGLRPLLAGAVVVVPASDEARFFSDVLPRLRRQVAVVSGDESVALPEPCPQGLSLVVRHLGEHRIGLAWGWLAGEGEQSEPLGLEDPPAGAERLLDSVASALGGRSELIEAGPLGDRPRPSAELAGMGAVRFLAEVLPELRRLVGVAVELDEAIPEYREAGEAPAVVLGGTTSEGGDWFDLTVNISIEGQEVPFQELFMALAAGADHMILPSGTYFPLDGPDLRTLAELISEARSLNDPGSNQLRLSRYQASLWEELGALGVVTGQAKAWEASVRSLTQAMDCTDHPVPPGLLATLRPYQHAGFNWLAYLYEHGLGGILADDMGLGKTLQALALVCHTKRAGATDPWLVVAPTSVVANWASECEKFVPGLRTSVIGSTAARRGEALADLAGRSDVVLSSYSLFRLEYAAYEQLPWAGLLLDEAQFAKNHASQAYQRARMLPVRFKVAMTGTPMENNLMELWSMLSITAPGLFPSPERFAREYRLPIERHGDADRLAQLRRRIRPLVLRRSKEQVVSDLPAKQTQVLELDLNPKHRRIYQTHLQRERQKVLGLLGDMDAHRFEILRSLTLLRQASLAPWLIDPAYEGIPSTKLEALSDMLTEIVADGHRVLVFSQFTRFLGAVRDGLSVLGIDHCYLDGRTRNRSAVISRFRQGAAPVFLISLKAGGFGLNLTEADYCILLDPWWNPATEAQAIDRVHRIGQSRNVMVYRLVAKDTIEEKVMALASKKAALFANVMDGGGFESGALTAEDIRGLLD